MKKKLERSSLMDVGGRADFAMGAPSYLAGQAPGTIVGRIEIEKKQHIPAYYLSKIMKDLVAGCLVRSHMGAKGGFSLSRPAETISIKKVYETVERPFVLMECLEKRQDYCSYCAVCTQRSIWNKAQSLLADYLERVSIRDIAAQYGLRERLAELNRRDFFFLRAKSSW